MTTKVPPAPRGLAKSGRALWRDVLESYELTRAEALTLTEACRVADRLDALAVAAADAPLTVTNARGDEVAQPLLVEARQQAIVFARLVAALRLPDEDTSAARPQRRGGVRGAYGVRGAVS